MATKIIAVLPAELREKSLLDLEIRGRRKGETLAIWESDCEQLTVLFDGAAGNSLEDYTRYPFIIAPGVEMIIRPMGRSRMSGAYPVAGIILDAPHHTLSYSYQKLWGSSYAVEARKYNKNKTLVPLDILWKYFTAMNFTWYHDASNLEKVRNTFDGFEDIITMNLHGMEVHIPLVEDPDDLVSMN